MSYSTFPSNSTYWSPEVTGVDMSSGTLSGLPLYEQQAYRIYQGAVVNITCPMMYRQQSGSEINTWYGRLDPTSQNGSSETLYLPYPNMTMTNSGENFTVQYVGGSFSQFQMISATTGIPLTHDDGSGDGNEMFQCTTETDQNSVSKSYFSFNFNSSGEICQLVTYYPYEKQPSNTYPVYIGGSPSSTYGVICKEGGSNATNSIMQAVLVVKTPSPYMTALGSFSSVNCCNGTYTTTDATDLQICEDQGFVGGASGCTSALGAYCVGETLATEQCIDYCNTHGVDCDTALTDFCSSDPIAAASTYVSVCGCFEGTESENAFRNNMVQQYPQLADIPNNPVCFYPPCSSASIRPYAFQTNTVCPNVQNCLTDIQISVDGGTINGNVAAFASCVLDTGANPGGGGDNTPNNDDSENNALWITVWVTIAVVVLLAIVFGIIILARRKSTAAMIAAAIDNDLAERNPELQASIEMTRTRRDEEEDAP